MKGFRVEILAICFFLANLPRVLHHAVWRDEAQAWLIARQSSSIPEIVHNLRYEGHPALWYLCLWLLQKFTGNVAAMGVFHLLLASGSVYLILKFAPFKWPEKILIALGYYFSFEYLVISRSYGLGAFLAVAFCVVQAFSVPWACVILGLLANTSVFGAIISIPLLGYLYVSRRGERGWALSFALYGALFLAAAWVMLPASDVVTSTALWHAPWERYRLQGALLVFSTAMLPIPSFAPGFWGTSVISAWTHLEQVLALIGVLGAMSAVLARSKLGLAGLWLGFIGTLEFAAMRYIGYIRHYGQFWVLFLCMVWLSLLNDKLSRGSRAVFLSLLIIQAIAGVDASVRAYGVPFSSSREAAEWLETHDVSKLSDVISTVGWTTPSVQAYLGPRILNVEPGQTEMFRLLKTGTAPATDALILEKIREVRDEDGAAWVIFPAKGPDRSLAASAGLHLMKSFGPSLTGEDVSIYASRN